MTASRFRALLAALVTISLVASAFAAPAAAAGDVTIEVNDDDGDALDGATVTLYSSTDDSEVASKTTSNGSVSFSSVADADYYAEVTLDGYASSTTSTFTVAGSAVTQSVSVSENMTEVANGTVSITADTNSLYGEADVSGSTDVTVTYYGIENGSETQLNTETISASNETAWSEYTLTSGDHANYSEARIVVEAQESDVSEADFGTLMIQSGGGSSGGLPGGSIYGIPVVALLLLGGAYVFIKGD